MAGSPYIGQMVPDLSAFIVTLQFGKLNSENPRFHHASLGSLQRRGTPCTNLDIDIEWILNSVYIFFHLCTFACMRF